MNNISINDIFVKMKPKKRTKVNIKIKDYRKSEPKVYNDILDNLDVNDPNFYVDIESIESYKFIKQLDEKTDIEILFDKMIGEYIHIKYKCVYTDEVDEMDCILLHYDNFKIIVTSTPNVDLWSKHKHIPRNRLIDIRLQTDDEFESWV